MKMDADIDIDFFDRTQILNLIKHTPARQESNTESKKHNSGVYVTDIPNDPIPRMAMFLALIRPAKKHLIGKSWDKISEEIWVKPSGDEYYFKKAHAVSYAVLVALHMNILNQRLELT